MNIITIVVLVFAILGAADKLFGDRLGLGKEFERAFQLFCPMMLSMLGMLVVSPAIGAWLTPAFEAFYKTFGIDPSVLPASLFANDMGGMPLAQAVCKSESMGNFNAFIVSAMMGCVISFTIPVSIGIVKPAQHRELFFGLLCGIVAIPVGCFVAGLICKLPVLALLLNLLPLILLSLIIGVALFLFPNGCIKVFSVFGFGIKTISLTGLVCAIFTFLTKIPINRHFNTLENAALICVNACITLSGTLPAMFVVSKLLHKQVNRLGAKIGIDGTSAVAFLSTIVTNTPTFGLMERMNKKGVVLNGAFAASAAFAFGSHLAFTMAFDSRYVAPMIIGKFTAGICAVSLALLLYKGKEGTNNEKK